MIYDLSPWLASYDSPKTREAYACGVGKFLAAVNVRRLSGLKGSHLAAFRAKLMDAGLAPASVCQTLAAVREFLRWTRVVAEEHSLSDDIIKAALPSPKNTVERPYDVLTDEEVPRVLAAASPADRAMIALMLGAGLRVSEVVKVRPSDLSEEDGGTTLRVRQAKGGKDRLVPLTPEVMAALKPVMNGKGHEAAPRGAAARIFAGEPPSDSPAARIRLGASEEELSRAPAYDSGWIADRRLFPITTGTVRARLRRVLDAAGVDRRITPHGLRHTFALRMLRHGGNVVAVATVLGHTSIQVTQRYVQHLERGELRAALPRLE